jgi:hypothetical protein
MFEFYGEEPSNPDSSYYWLNEVNDYIPNNQPNYISIDKPYQNFAP